MRITNKHSTALGLPTGQVLPAGEPTEVEGWKAVKENTVVQAWLKAGILVEADDKPAKTEKAAKAKPDDKPAKD